MARIQKQVLVVNQMLHIRTPAGIGGSRLSVRAMRLVTDHFERVVSLTPVRDSDDSEASAVEFYPSNVEPRVLFRRGVRESKRRAAMLLLASIPRIWREVGACDIVYGRLPHYPATIASCMALLSGKPLMISIHGNWGDVLLARRGSGLLWRALARASDDLHRFLASRSKLTMVTGSATRRLGGRNAVLISQHQFEQSDMYRRDDTCQSHPIRLLYVGLLSCSKGTDVLLDALARLRERGTDCVLTLVGRESSFDIAAEVRARGLDEHVTVVGQVDWGDDLFAYHRASDIFVFPSLSEGSPKAPMEALSQSLPVVSTRTGTSDYVQHERSGLLVNTSDVGALVRAIERMVGDGELRRRCIDGGRAVANEHTRSRMSDRILGVLTVAFE